MVVAAGFEVTSSCPPTSLTVVGGGSVKTEYGSYWFNIEPRAGGEYHEISCVGMDSVTSKFNKYDLSEICSEYVSQADPSLPKYVGVLKYTYYLELKILI